MLQNLLIAWTNCHPRERVNELLIRENGLSYSRERIAIRENELSNSRERVVQFEGTSCPIRGNELLIRWNDITIYLWFFLNPHVLSGLSYFSKSQFRAYARINNCNIQRTFPAHVFFYIIVYVLAFTHCFTLYSFNLNLRGIRYIRDILPFRNRPKHWLGFVNERNSPGDQIRHSMIHYTCM